MWLILLKMGSNRPELSEECSIFAFEKSKQCHLTTQIDGIDRNFPFGKVAPTPAPGVQPLLLAFGGHTGESGPSPIRYLIY